MNFKLWLEQEVEIKEPYYRVVSDTMHGASAIKKLGSEIAPGTYWTPRWDAILMMIRSIALNSKIHKIDGNIKVYQTNHAIMAPSPKEHQWAFKYSVDAGEMVLVKLLDQPKIIHNMSTNDEEIEGMIDQSFQTKPPIDHSRQGMAAKLKDGSDVWITPRSNRIEVAKKNGWQFNVIQTISSLQQWKQFESQLSSADWESEAGLGLAYFFHDMNWQ